MMMLMMMMIIIISIIIIIIIIVIVGPSAAPVHLHGHFPCQGITKRIIANSNNKPK